MNLLQMMAIVLIQLNLNQISLVVVVGNKVAEKKEEFEIW